MAYSYFTQLFSGGINQDMAPVMLDLAQQNSQLNLVASAQNFLFERGEAISRPGTVNNPVSFPSGSIMRTVKFLPFPARSFKSPVYDRLGFFILDSGNLYSMEARQAATVFTPTHITGAGFTMFSDAYCDHSIVNGVVMIGGNTGGLIRWDPNNTTYTVISAAKYQYICGHLSRAVAAYDVSQSNVGYQQQVAWSAPGDETTWTGSTSGAGLSILADVEDSITGVKVCNGVVLIARTYGFHIGIPTGQFPAVYDFRKLSSMSVGCMHPATLQIYKNVAFFMSGNGIHMYDLNDIADIGEGVYKEISFLINNQQLTPRAFMSNSYSMIDFQPSYNIVLDSPSTTLAQQVPHYMYNLKEQRWSRHFYNGNSLPSVGYSNLVGSFDYLTNATSLNDPAPISSMTVFQRGSGASAPQVSTWVGADSPDGTGQSALDTVASWTTGQITLDDPLHDMQTIRVQLFYYAPPQIGGFQFTITASGTLNGVQVSETVTVQTYPAGGWTRQWVNLRLTANAMQFVCSLPVSTPGPVRFKQMTIEYTSVGKTRV